MNKRHAQKQLLALYYAIYAALIIELTLAHIIPSCLQTITPDALMVVQAIAILLLLVFIPLSLKMYAVKMKTKVDLSYYMHWSRIQMLLLSIPGVCAGLAYYFLKDRSMLFCFLIALVALIFSKPTPVKMDAYLVETEDSI